MSAWWVQGFRFGIVGLASNAVLFIFYIVLTSIGVGPKLAMTCMFMVGTGQTFFFNKRWTFGHNDLAQKTFVKYFLVYGFAYMINLGVLSVLVDRVGYPHQIVQGLMVLFLAMLIFVLQKFWVFEASVDSRNMGS